jgi:hypothetical protein
VAALSSLLPACGTWVSVNRVSSAQKKPNNAWVFFSVERGGEPVTGLAADDLTIQEDGSPVTKEDTKQILQSPDVAAVMYTLLLVDLSGTSTAAAPDALVDAAKAFADRTGKAQKVGVYAFDGDEKIHPIVPFTDAQTAAPGAFDALRRFRTKDPSTNLHGAVVEGLRELRRALEREHRPLRFGTLVVLGQGIDRANRVSRDVMRNEWDDDKYKLYEVLAVGAGADHSYLDDVGRDGVDAAVDGTGLKDALDRTAAKIEAHGKRYYLLSFCTAGRKGDREVRVQVHLKDPDGSGSFTYTFNADGLGPPPECDSKTPPSFDLKATDEKPKERDDARPPAKGSPKGGPKQLLIDTPPPEKPAPML